MHACRGPGSTSCRVSPGGRPDSGHSLCSSSQVLQYRVHYAVGQGALAVECRQEDVQTLAILSALHHRYFQYRVHYSVGQGALAVKCRQEGFQTLAIFSALHHRYFQHLNGAVGQGALAVEGRQEDVQTLAILSALHHRYFQHPGTLCRWPGSTSYRVSSGGRPDPGHSLCSSSQVPGTIQYITVCRESHNLSSFVWGTSILWPSFMALPDRDPLLFVRIGISGYGSGFYRTLFFNGFQFKIKKKK